MNTEYFAINLYLEAARKHQDDDLHQDFYAGSAYTTRREMRLIHLQHLHLLLSLSLSHTNIHTLLFICTFTAASHFTLPPPLGLHIKSLATLPTAAMATPPSAERWEYIERECVQCPYPVWDHNYRATTANNNTAGTPPAPKAAMR